MMNKDVEKTVSGTLRRAGYGAAGAALGAVTGRALGWMVLGPIGYRVGEVAGAVAGGALGFQLSGEPASPGPRPASRKEVVVTGEAALAGTVDAVFG